MRIAMFYHSLLSDWNHGNAHFLRGVVAELTGRGHDVRVYEPRDGWSLQNLRREHGEAPIAQFHERYPSLHPVAYDLKTLDLDAALNGVDLAIVHEWSDHELVRRIGRDRARLRAFGCYFTIRTTVPSPNLKRWPPMTCPIMTACSPTGTSCASCTCGAAGRLVPGPGTRPPTRAFFIRSTWQGERDGPGMGWQLG